jgi:hypothetical protein
MIALLDLEDVFLKSWKIMLLVMWLLTRCGVSSRHEHGQPDPKIAWPDHVFWPCKTGLG